MMNMMIDVDFNKKILMPPIIKFHSNEKVFKKHKPENV